MWGWRYPSSSQSLRISDGQTAPPSWDAHGTVQCDLKTVRMTWQLWEVGLRDAWGSHWGVGGVSGGSGGPRRFSSWAVTWQREAASGGRWEVMGIWLRKAAGGRGEAERNATNVGAWPDLMVDSVQASKHPVYSSRHRNWPERPPPWLIQDDSFGKVSEPLLVLNSAPGRSPVASGLWRLPDLAGGLFLGYPELISVCNKFNCSQPQQIVSHFPQLRLHDFGTCVFPRIGPSSTVLPAIWCPHLLLFPTAFSLKNLE